MTNPNPSQDRVELKPCPFCRGKAFLNAPKSSFSYPFYRGCCTKCGSEGPSFHTATCKTPEASAIAAWNTRPESEPVTVMREALEQIAETPNAGWIIARATLAKLSHGSVGD